MELMKTAPFIKASSLSAPYTQPNLSNEYGLTAGGADAYFVHNGVLFLLINAHAKGSPADQHKAFIQQAIEETKDQDIKWKVVCMHSSFYSNVTDNANLGYDRHNLRSTFMPVFQEMGIDVVFSGHDHIYARSYMLDGVDQKDTDAIYTYDGKGVPVSVSNSDGVLYVAGSSPGNRCNSMAEKLEWVAVQGVDKRQNISNVTVTDTTFNITTYYTADMSVLDTFTIHKGVEQTDIALNMGADETEMNITWYSNAAGTGAVKLVKQSDLVGNAMPESAKTFSATGVASSQTGYNSYQTTMTGLKPNTAYAYQLVNGEKDSDIYTFTTGGTGAFSFAYVGDPQIGAGNTTTDTTGWGKTLNIIAGDKTFSDVSFMLSAGDQVNTANNEEQYDGYLNHETLKNLPMATVIGNHDNSAANYDQHFNVANESSEYGTSDAGGDNYFVYNNTLFMVLNTNDLSTAEHKAFMKTAIEATKEQDIRWKIVTFHHSIYTVASHYNNDNTNRREELAPVFDELGIDVVLQGHDHVYCRTYIMDGLTPVTDKSKYDDENYASVTDPDGILYVTANSASGSKHYDIKTSVEFPYSAVQNQEKVPNVSKVTVSDTQFTITTYRTTDMSVVDTFTINKTAQPTDEPAKLLIDQVYGDGGKGETPIANSFIELYNPNDTAVSLDSYTLVYGDKTLTLDAAKSIPAKGSYLIVGASANTTAEYQTYNLPEADQTCDDWQISNKSYTITLKKGETVLDSVTADENVDEIKVSKQKTLQRVNHVDTDTNNDFRIVVWEKDKMTATAETLTQYAPHNSKGEYGSLVAAEPEKPVYTPVKTSDTRVKGYYDATGSLKLELAGRYNSGAMNADGGSLEIVQYNPVNGYAYAVSGVKGKLIAVNLNSSLDGDTVVTLFGTEYDLSKESFGIADFTYGDMTSVAISPDGSKLAVAIQAENYNENGVVAIFTCEADGSLTLDRAYTVGVQPDMVTFADNDTVLSADEGEPREGVSGTDPKGSVSIVEISGTVNTVTFDSFDDQRAELIRSGVLIQKDSAPSTDFEPEYIAVSNGTAYVALQEANAIAVLNIADGEFTGVYPLGLQDYSKTKVDLQKNDTIELTNYENVYGIKMPDGISVVTIGGKDYLLTANEGDSRADWAGLDNESEGKTSPTGNVTLEKKVVWFDATKWDGLDTDKAYVFGGRSFSIYEVTADGLTLTYDSGSDFEEITAEQLPDYFNCSNDKISLDNRSGKKGPEPESVITGTVKDKTYAFIALERIGGVMVYDITVPANAKFVNYINSREFDDVIQGDVSPEGLCFVSAADSKTGNPMLLAACEVSGTMTVVQIETATGGGTSGGSSSGGTSSSGQYTIKAEAGQGGTISPNGSIRVDKGKDQTFTVKANNGYNLKDVLVDGKSVGAVSSYTFENVRAAHTIKAVFGSVEETVENPFVDVAKDAWYKDAVDYVYNAGLMSGTGATTFAPNVTTTRGMIVTILYRMENTPAVSSNTVFSDVPAGQYYTDAVAWAAANGIVGGYGNGTFGPNDFITREQLVTMLWRYAGSPKSNYALDSFQDQGEVAGYAATAMSWAVEHGIVSGTSATTLSPADASTRAQLATILMRFCAVQTD
jgi:predicted phosphodiesterase